MELTRNQKVTELVVPHPTRPFHTTTHTTTHTTPRIEGCTPCIEGCTPCIDCFELKERTEFGTNQRTGKPHTMCFFCLDDRLMRSSECQATIEQWKAAQTHCKWCTKEFEDGDSTEIDHINWRLKGHRAEVFSNYGGWGARPAYYQQLINGLKTNAQLLHVVCHRAKSRRDQEEIIWGPPDAEALTFCSGKADRQCSTCHYTQPAVEFLSFHHRHPRRLIETCRKCRRMNTVAKPN